MPPAMQLGLAREVLPSFLLPLGERLGCPRSLLFYAEHGPMFSITLRERLGLIPSGHFLASQALLDPPLFQLPGGFVIICPEKDTAKSTRFSTDGQLGQLRQGNPGQFPFHNVSYVTLLSHATDCVEGFYLCSSDLFPFSIVSPGA